MNDHPLHFVHVADSHVASGATREADLERLGSVVERIRALHAGGVPIDFVVHGGDLVDDADEPDARPDTTEVALGVLDALPVRWFLLNGNHDRRSFLVAGAADADGRRPHGLGEVPATDASGVAVRLVGTVQLLFVDAVPATGGASRVEGEIRAEAIERVAGLVDAHAGRSAVFLHYPPLRPEADWAGGPAGGKALHAALAARSERLHGVFVAHNHRGLHHVRDGVPYSTVPALSRQLLLWPGQKTFAFDDEPVHGLHYVTLEADGSTRVQHHAFVAAGPGARAAP